VKVYSRNLAPIIRRAGLRIVKHFQEFFAVAALYLAEETFAEDRSRLHMLVVSATVFGYHTFGQGHV
jgi:hypothetical protein